MSNKVVLVTGATQGIGLSTVEMLSTNDRMTVYGTTRKTSDRSLLSAVVSQSQGRAKLIELDVTDGDSVQSVIDTILENEGRLDVVVNNACHVAFGNVESCSIDQQMLSMDVNYWGVVRVLQSSLPALRDSQGQIINISSLSGIDPFPQIETYSTTKFALEGLSEALATSLSAWGIRVSLIEPGGVKTNAPVNAEFGDRNFPDSHLWSAFFKRAKEMMIATYVENALEPSDVANVICEVIDCEKPHLRYQIGEFTKKVAAERFSDPTGDTSVKAKQGLLKEMGLFDLIGGDQ